MNLKVYSVYDKAVALYARPFFLQSDGQAMRGFLDEAENAESAINKHPEDYALFRLGEYSEETGQFKSEEPVCLCRAHELIARKGE